MESEVSTYQSLMLTTYLGQSSGRNFLYAAPYAYSCNTEGIMVATDSVVPIQGPVGKDYQDNWQICW